MDVAGSNRQKLAEWGFPNVVSLQMHTGSNSDAEISNNFINQLNVLSIMSVNYSLVKMAGDTSATITTSPVTA